MVYWVPSSLGFQISFKSSVECGCFVLLVFKALAVVVPSGLERVLCKAYVRVDSTVCINQISIDDVFIQ